MLVMAAAWTLVVLSEWAAAAKRARWHLDEIAPPLEPDAADTTGPWDMPVVQATVVEAAPDPESKTIVTKLPAEPRRGRAGAGRRAGACSEAPPRAPTAEADRRGGRRRSLGARFGVMPRRRGAPGGARRELLAAAVVAAALVAVPGAIRTTAGACAEGLLRPHRGALRNRTEAADRARVRPRRPPLRDPGDRRGGRGRPRLLEAARARPRLRDAARADVGRLRTCSSRRKATSAASPSAAGRSSRAGRS